MIKKTFVQDPIGEGRKRGLKTDTNYVGSQKCSNQVLGRRASGDIRSKVLGPSYQMTSKPNLTIYSTPSSSLLSTTWYS